jgi:hypothetical protein
MLGLILVLFLTPNAEAQTKARGTDIYEQEAGESTTKSVTGKIRVVREVSDEVEVFFEGDKIPGAYTLPRGLQHYGTMLKALEESKKANGPAVTVTADEDKRIKTVELKGGSAGSAGSAGTYKFPDDPNKKWDIDAALESSKKK